MANLESETTVHRLHPLRVLVSGRDRRFVVHAQSERDRRHTAVRLDCKNGVTAAGTGA